MHRNPVPDRPGRAHREEFAPTFGTGCQENEKGEKTSRGKSSAKTETEEDGRRKGAEGIE